MISNITNTFIKAEKAFDDDKNLVVAVNKMYFRPNEVHDLLGDSSKAKEKLGWRPKISFLELVQEMIEYDFNLVKSNN